MFGDWFLKLAAHFAGFTEAQLSIIEKAMPSMRKLIALVVQAQPLVQKAEPVINELLPLVKQAMTLVDPASKEFQAIGPAISILIKVIQHDLEQGKTRDEAAHAVTSKVEDVFGWM